MQPDIKPSNDSSEFETEERCSILEVANDANDPDVSIARARVKPGVTTAWHQLKGTTERYLILFGQGRVEIDTLQATDVGAGDVVRITRQHATTHYQYRRNRPNFLRHLLAALSSKVLPGTVRIGSKNLINKKIGLI
jgi:mannose-6-phosphate isomerase-like protein (cupin superfamily)